MLSAAAYTEFFNDYTYATTRKMPMIKLMTLYIEHSSADVELNKFNLNIFISRRDNKHITSCQSTLYCSCTISCRRSAQGMCSMNTSSSLSTHFAVDWRNHSKNCPGHCQRSVTSPKMTRDPGDPN